VPTYEYLCDTCGSKFDRTLPVAMYASLQHCKCGAAARKLISAPAVFVPQDICYDSPIDGRPITSMQARIEDLKRADCVPWEPGIAQDGERRKREEEAALDAKIDATVDQFIDALPEHKKTELANELAAGSDVDFVRQ
jgi:putative FmdB family regulatory protein